MASVDICAKPAKITAHTHNYAKARVNLDTDEKTQTHAGIHAACVACKAKCAACMTKTTHPVLHVMNKLYHP